MGLVEGTVFRAGKRVRITVQLLHAPTDRHIWATSYGRGFRDVLTLQKDLAEAIAHEISSQLNTRRRPRRSIARLHNTDAHEAYLKGRHCWNQRTEEGLNQSIEFYTEAISKDPGYALAYSGLADSYALLGSRRLGGIPPHEVMVKAKEAASKALHLDQTLAEAHTALAFVRFQSDWDWAGAEREFRSAIDLNPNSATSRYRYAMYLATMSRMREAMSEMKRAQELDPLSPNQKSMIGSVQYYARRYDAAEEQYRQLIHSDPDIPGPHLRLYDIYSRTGKESEAVAELQKGLALQGAEELAAALPARYSSSGFGAVKKFALQEQIRLLTEASKQDYISPIALATNYAVLGEKDKAFEWLEKAYEEHAPGLLDLDLDPDYDNLHTDKRFQNLLRRINIPQ